MEGRPGVSFLPKWTARRRARAAARRLGTDPSPENYVTLAREHVVVGDLMEVLRVCSEGLELHPGHAELTRVADRARSLQLDSRVQSLGEELRLAPRPALWRELCDVLLECAKLQRAEESAQEWFHVSGDPEAVYYLARCRAEMFFDSRRAEDGRTAWEHSKKAVRDMAGDTRPLELQYELARSCGAWGEARTAVAKLLELSPGNPELEVRFRSASARAHGARSIVRALAEVEQTGRFVDDTPEVASAQANVAVRPLLQALGQDPEIKAAIFQRGGTALVQGLHGATADRTARSVREVVQSSRASARRMALGRPLEISLEGDFGTLLLSPGELGAAAIWSRGRATRQHMAALQGISGAAGAAAGGLS